MAQGEQRTSRAERVVLGAYLLACWAAVVSAFVNEPFEGLGSRLEPHLAQARAIQAVALLTLVATVVLAVRSFGAGRGLRLLAREAWPGLLTGAALGFVTGAPMRALVPADRFWLALVPAYAGGVLLVRWFALRAPPEG
jgi:hypothetical protein